MRCGHCFILFGCPGKIQLWVTESKASRKTSFVVEDGPQCWSPSPECYWPGKLLATSAYGINVSQTLVLHWLPVVRNPCSRIVWLRQTGAVFGTLGVTLVIIFTCLLPHTYLKVVQDWGMLKDRAGLFSTQDLFLVHGIRVCMYVCAYRVKSYLISITILACRDMSVYVWGCVRENFILHKIRHTLSWKQWNILPHHKCSSSRRRCVTSTYFFIQRWMMRM